MPAHRASADFGRKLRESRERRGLSLRQVANATKIAMPTLEALERNDISRLPGGIFSRAFVRSYALEVGLDPDEAIEEFLAQFPNDAMRAGHGRLEQDEENEAVESDRRIATTILGLLFISIPIAGALLYFGGKGRRAELRANQTVATAPVSGQRDPSVETAGMASATPAPSPVAGAIVPSSDPSAFATDRLRVGLSTSRSTWVSALVDDQIAFEGVLEPGERRTIDVRREMVLTARDAAALTMTLNGAEAKPLGRADEIVTARLNPANFKEFLPTR